MAEQSGLIGKLGEQLLTVACRRAALWPGNLKLSVNLAASDLEFANDGNAHSCHSGCYGFSVAAACRLK